MKKSNHEDEAHSDSTFSVDNTTPSSGSLESVHTPSTIPESPQQKVFENFLDMLDKNTKNEKRQSIGNEAMYNLFCTDSISSRTFLTSLNTEKDMKENRRFCNFSLSQLAILLSILTAVFVAIIVGSIFVYVYTNKASTNKNWETVGYFILFGLIHKCLTALFIFGIVKNRSKWMLPLLFITIVFFIASVGVLITLIITLDSDIHEVIRRANIMNAGVEHKISLQEIFMRIFVLFILLAVTYQFSMTIVYVKVYRQMTKKN